MMQKRIYFQDTKTNQVACLPASKAKSVLRHRHWQKITRKHYLSRLSM